MSPMEWVVIYFVGCVWSLAVFVAGMWYGFLKGMQYGRKMERTKL